MYKTIIVFVQYVGIIWESILYCQVERNTVHSTNQIMLWLSTIDSLSLPGKINITKNTLEQVNIAKINKNVINL